MKTYPRPHRSGRALLRDASTHARQEREGRDKLVVDIAEIDARRVYREAGYPSTVTYCMDELELSKKAALHRIHVARVAWRLPAILAALTEGRLHLTAVSILATHLNEENVDELVAAAERKTKEEIRKLILERFPRRDLFGASEIGSSESLFVASCDETKSPLEAESGSQRRPDGVEAPRTQSESWPIVERCPDVMDVPLVPVKLPPARFPLRISLRQETHVKLRHAQELLGHQVPSGDVSEVLDRALDALIARLEKRKFGATDRPRACKTRKVSDSRYIPAEVRRAVAARDGRQCTFVSDTGKRCPARKLLEFDHVVEFARGGQSTEDNLRLRCRAHNQYTAEQTYGAEHMRHKREEAQRAAAARAKVALEAQARMAAAKEQSETLIGALRRLGFTADESRRAAAHCETVPEASLEARMRAALAYLVPPRCFVGAQCSTAVPSRSSSASCRPIPIECDSTPCAFGPCSWPRA